MAIICVVFAIGLVYAAARAKAWRSFLIVCCLVNLFAASHMIITDYPCAFRLMPYGLMDD